MIWFSPLPKIAELKTATCINQASERRLMTQISFLLWQTAETIGHRSYIIISVKNDLLVRIEKELANAGYVTQRIGYMNTETNLQISWE